MSPQKLFRLKPHKLYLTKDDRQFIRDSQQQIRDKLLQRLDDFRKIHEKRGDESTLTEEEKQYLTGDPDQIVEDQMKKINNASLEYMSIFNEKSHEMSETEKVEFYKNFQESSLERQLLGDKYDDPYDVEYLLTKDPVQRYIRRAI